MKNSQYKGLIPIAHRINSWGTEGTRKILFKCPQCDTSFFFHQEDEKYCHNCGQKIYWEGVKVNLITDPVLIKDCTGNLKKYRETIDKINKINLEVKDDSYGPGEETT